MRIVWGLTGCAWQPRKTSDEFTCPLRQTRPPSHKLPPGHGSRPSHRAHTFAAGGTRARLLLIGMRQTPSQVSGLFFRSETHRAPSSATWSHREQRPQLCRCYLLSSPQLCRCYLLSSPQLCLCCLLSSPRRALGRKWLDSSKQWVATHFSAFTGEDQHFRRICLNFVVVGGGQLGHRFWIWAFGCNLGAVDRV